MASFTGRPSFLGLLPFGKIKNLTPVLDQLRLIKSPAEIALLRKATQLSGRALMEGMRSTKPGENVHLQELVVRGLYRYVRNPMYELFAFHDDVFYFLQCSVGPAKNFS